jgi:hypothetical protein
MHLVLLIYLKTEKKIWVEVLPLVETLQWAAVTQ